MDSIQWMQIADHIQSVDQNTPHKFYWNRKTFKLISEVKAIHRAATIPSICCIDSPLTINNKIMISFRVHFDDLKCIFNGNSLRLDSVS